MTKYPRGSQWRRWDLHVHTPASIVQEFGGDTPAAWDSFIHTLQTLPADVSVIGITDYLFVDGYERLLARRSEIPNITTILANIEFRLDTFAGTTGNHKRHNFHVLFDPSVTPQTIREQLLNCLSKAYKIDDRTEWSRTPTLASLAELGAKMKAVAPQGNGILSKTDLQAGFDSITYKCDDILENLKKDCFKGKYLIGIGYSEWDQSRWDQSAAEKRTLINIADFALTCNDDIGKISENVEDLKTNKLNSLVLHSSDAHKLDRIGQTKLWIKSDPTFAGLKQVINERDRAFLGDAPPRFRQAHEVIDKIVIPASGSWFANDFTLELNEGLVAIIGGRGSGKSALAEMIAAGAGACDPSDESFVNKASKHDSPITGASVELTWADGTVTSEVVGSSTETDGRVKYLPQKAVEELCSPDHSETLIAQIENVIFQALDAPARLGASDFRELRANVLGSYEFEKEQIIGSLEQYHALDDSLELTIKGLPVKQKELEARTKELAQLTRELPKLPQADEKAQNELADLLVSKKAFEDRIVTLKKLIEHVGQAQTKIRLFQSSFTAFADEIVVLVRSLGIGDLSPFMVSLDADSMQRALAARSLEIQNQIDILRTGGSAEVSGVLGQTLTNPAFTNYSSLTLLIEARGKETKAFETQKIKFQQQKLKIAQTEKTIESLKAEIARIETDIKPQRDEVQKQRFAKYCEYFKVLDSERVEITKLYGPLQESLEQGSETDRRLRFEAKFTYAISEHLEKGKAILDRTKRGNFRDVESLKQSLSRLWDSYLKNSFSDAAIRKALKALWLEFTTLDLGGTPTSITVESQLRDGYSMQEFFDWFFDPRNFKVTSSLTFDDTDLYLLSPGQKGIVLLMLYLGMDRSDTRPLVIDQPEDNLDNLSVYEDLIGLFRERKQSRQIILVTHNPNLVVNTDAEQVVVASYNGKKDPRISYDAGSLENQAEHIPDVQVRDLTDGIIEKVCAILEGGPSAFGGRSKVYSLSPKIN